MINIWIPIFLNGNGTFWWCSDNVVNLVKLSLSSLFGMVLGIEISVSSLFSVGPLCLYLLLHVYIFFLQLSYFLSFFLLLLLLLLVVLPHLRSSLESHDLEVTRHVHLLSQGEPRGETFAFWWSVLSFCLGRKLESEKENFLKFFFLVVVGFTLWTFEYGQLLYKSFS